jgi:hypothetical protein
MGGGNWGALAELTADMAGSLVQGLVDKKKARLNDLRAGC